MVDFGRGGKGSMNWKRIETTLPCRVACRATRDQIFIGGALLFFLTSPLPPLTEGRKHRDEPAVKMADSYVRDRATLRRQDVCV